MLICCLGFFNFSQQRDPLKLWVPENSKFLINTKVIMNNFEEGFRAQNVLMVAEDNVLTPEVMKKLAVIDREINDIKTIGEEGEEIDFEKICFK